MTDDYLSTSAFQLRRALDDINRGVYDTIHRAPERYERGGVGEVVFGSPAWEALQVASQARVPVPVSVRLPKADGGSLPYFAHEDPDKSINDALRFAKELPAAREEPTLRAYEPSIGEKVSSYLMGDSRPTPERRRVAESIGSLVGFMPADPYQAAGEAVQQFTSGHPIDAFETMFGAMPQTGVIPGVPKGGIMSPGLFGIKPSKPEGIIAYHGSPHKFTQFDPSKMGTGEGGGYEHIPAMYFTEDPHVAETYRQTLTRLNNNKGHLYRTSLFVDPSRLINWELPFRRQPTPVKEILSENIPSWHLNKIKKSDTIGGDLVNLMLEDHENEFAIANKLREFGIDGFVYPGESSGGEHIKGKMNYGIFDPSKIEITHVNGEPLIKRADGGAVTDLPYFAQGNDDVEAALHIASQPKVRYDEGPQPGEQQLTRSRTL